MLNESRHIELWRLLLFQKLPAVVGQLLYPHAHRIFGQKLLYQLGPLYEAQCSAVEILLVSHVVDLLQTLYPVEVEVVDRLRRDSWQVIGER